MDSGVVSLLRRDRLWNHAAKPDFTVLSVEQAVGATGELLEEIQHGLFDEARTRRDANITRGITSMDEVAAHYAAEVKFAGWLEVQWSKPYGNPLAHVVAPLTAHKLKIRNMPRDSDPADGPRIFTGRPAVQPIHF